jgi:hypothetical protein
MNTLRQGILFSLLLCSIGYSQEQPNLTAKISPTISGPRIKSKNGANVSLSTEMKQFSGEQTIKLTLSLKNTGDKEFEILLMDVDRFYQIEVIGPDGKPLTLKKPKRSIYKALADKNNQMVDEESVRPGKTIKAMVWLSNLYDMTAVGTYKINAKTVFLLGNAAETVEIKAEQISIEVITAPPLSQWL